jgi:uncharacterized protein involved in response to NO
MVMRETAGDGDKTHGTRGVRATRQLLAAPHRFFFLVGVVQTVAIAVWWAWVLAAREGFAPPAGAALPDSTAHALLMLCGFAPFFMFGFLFTAGPRWLAAAPLPRAAWLIPGIVAAAGALALVPLQLAGLATAMRGAAGLYALGWVGLLVRFGGLIRAGEARDRIHPLLVALALAIGASTVAGVSLFGPAPHGWLRDAGTWAFLLPVFAVVCHRMIPFFTANVVPQVAAFRPGWLLALLAGAPTAHGILSGSGLAGATWVVDLPAAALLAWLVWRWGIVQSLRNHLLAMLHVGFLWYAIGFLLAGVQSLVVAGGGLGAPLAPLHALTVGFAGSLMMAMVTRVTCGHSGRTLAADALTWGLFQLLQVTAIVRVGAGILPGSGWLAAAALLWCACFVPWCVKYAPVYWRPRADGRPG